MASISSVSFYLSKTSNRTGWDMYCSIMDVGLYTADLGDDVILGSSNAVSIDDIPNHGSEGWVTFTFGTPVTISTTGFYGLKLWGNTSDYQVAGVYVYDSDDWSDASGGEPYTDKERGWKFSSSSWAAGITPAYNMSYGGDANTALTPAATYSVLGQYSSDRDSGSGVRSYLAAPPSKPINPTPEHEESGISLSATTVTWEDGGDADTYNIYYGTLSGFLTLVAEGVTDLEIALITGNFDYYGEVYYWRVDAVNDAGTTQGDEWYFTALIYDPVLPTGITLVDEEPTGDPTGENNMITVRRLVAAANSKIWYEDI